MTIGVVATSYPRFAGDHAGNFVEGHVRALRALGHDVEVIAAGSPVGLRPPSLRQGDDSGAPDSPGVDVSRARPRPRSDAPVTRIPTAAFTGGGPDRLERSPLRTSLAAAAFFARLAVEIRRRRHWTAIIAHWLPCAIAALPAGKPILAIAHGGDVHALARYRLLLPTVAALRAHRIAFVSDELRAIAGDPTHSFVQPMGIDLDRFAAIAPARTAPPTILVVARLVPIKGVDVAIAAMQHLGDVRLVIAGDGPERAALIHRAAGDPRIHFAGEVDADHRDRLLARSSVVVVPSRILANGRTEGSPMIAIEAMAANVPVVASAVGGLAALPGVRAVPPESPAELAAAIASELAMPRPVRDFVVHRDWRIVAQRLLDCAV